MPGLVAVFGRWTGREEGQDLLEYALLVALIALLAAGAVGAVGTQINQTFWQAIVPLVQNI